MMSVENITLINDAISQEEQNLFSHKWIILALQTLNCSLILLQKKGLYSAVLFKKNGLTIISKNLIFPVNWMDDYFKEFFFFIKLRKQSKLTGVTCLLQAIYGNLPGISW